MDKQEYGEIAAHLNIRAGRGDGVWETQEQADVLLEEIRSRMDQLQSAWRNPQYGIPEKSETLRLVLLVRFLDRGIQEGAPAPTAWTH